MIGKAYKSRLSYYDRVSKSEKFKSRPCLIIGQADEGDYIILPISSISDKSKIDPVYDIPLKCERFHFLKKDSYLRTHKQTFVHRSSLKDELIDFKALYRQTYDFALDKVRNFQNGLIDKATE